MVTFRNRRLSRLRKRLGVMVERTRRSEERLRLSMDRMRANQDRLTANGYFYLGPPDHVLRLLHRDEQTEAGGLGPCSLEDFGSLLDPEPRAVQGDGSAGHITFQEVFDPYQQEPAGYISHTSGGWLATMVDCE